MERVLCKEIVLEGYAVGTMDVMDYADKHPNEYFDHTNVRSKNTDFGQLMVSEYNPCESVLECFEHGSDLPNGWQRYSDGYCYWICRKNDRYIFITN